MMQADVFVREGTRVAAGAAITCTDGSTALTVAGELGGTRVWGVSLFGRREDLRAFADAIVAALADEQPYAEKVA